MTREEKIRRLSVHNNVGLPAHASMFLDMFEEMERIQQEEAKLQPVGAAPDLYRALELMVSWFDDATKPTPNAILAAKAALAKARGECP
jgi:hypothetical protein